MHNIENIRRQFDQSWPLTSSVWTKLVEKASVYLCSMPVNLISKIFTRFQIGSSRFGFGSSLDHSVIGIKRFAILSGSICDPNYFLGNLRDPRSESISHCLLYQDYQFLDLLQIRNYQRLKRQNCMKNVSITSISKKKFFFFWNYLKKLKIVLVMIITFSELICNLSFESFFR